MDLQNEKCVMVIDENLPLGIIANYSRPGCGTNIFDGQESF